FNEIFPDTFPYINEATKANLLKGTPEKYFITKKGTDVHAYMSELPIAGAVGKEYLGLIIAECFRQYHTTRTSVILDK
ncbi:hypothetical protein NL389_39935, partial [Klebsiella pneumoniae]|nr:hypothetical protein [Klebsiella pneumoniae]